MTKAITATEAFVLIEDDKAILIDVREADEFKGGHIAGAISVPLSSLEDGFKMLDIPKDKTILFQCLKGARGKMACERIQKLGLYQNKMINLEGGIQAWKESGLPVIGA
jgi:rhodanese-related sulfurtransferase